MAAVGGMFCNEWIRRVREAIMQRLIASSFRGLLIDPSRANQLDEDALLAVRCSADVSGLRLQSRLPEWQRFHVLLADALSVPTLPVLANPFSPLLLVRAQHESLVSVGFSDPSACVVRALSNERVAAVLAVGYRSMSRVIEAEPA
jgi:hypothetical protein